MSLLRLTTRRVLPGLAGPIARTTTRTRGYAAGYYPPKKSSDIPWIIASAVVTIPGAAFLISLAPTPSPEHHHDKRAEPTEESKEHAEKTDSSAGEGEGGGDEQSAKGGLGENEDAKSETEGDKNKTDERTTEGTQRQSFGGKPNVKEGTEDAEAKNSGQVHADSGKERHKTDIKEAGGNNMPKTQDTVRK